MSLLREFLKEAFEDMARLSAERHSERREVVQETPPVKSLDGGAGAVSKGVSAPAPLKEVSRHD